MAALYQSFGSVAGISEIEVTSVSGKTVKLAVGILTLLITTAYTANLASLLVVKKSWASDIQNLSDVSRLGAKVCAVNKIIDFLEICLVFDRGPILARWEAQSARAIFCRRNSITPFLEGRS